jgi:hypothetical protein
MGRASSRNGSLLGKKSRNGGRRRAGNKQETEKSLFHPTSYEGWNTSPPTYENNFSPELYKSSPKAILKNHNKSLENHKMENPIVLDSK